MSKEIISKTLNLFVMISTCLLPKFNAEQRIEINETLYEVN